MSIWDRFDTIATPTEVETASAMFTPIQAGDYSVILESLEASETQAGAPMLKGKFRTKENKIVFYNQVLQNMTNPQMTAVNIAEAIKFLEGITSEKIEFTGLGQLANIVSNITFGGEFTINVKYGAKDLEMKFPKITVLVGNVPF